MKPLKAAIALTSHKQMGNTRMSTGFYLSEATHPTYELEKNGCDVTMVSTLGGSVPMDENSRDMSDPLNRDFMGRADFVEKIENTNLVVDLDPAAYQAIIFAGGHGAMWDFPVCEELASFASKIYRNGGIIAAVCHGAAALTNIFFDDEYLVTGKKVTGFSNAEEEALGLTKTMPFLLEDKLKELGAYYSKAPIWQKHIVIDGRIITGQNPASAQALGEAVALMLKMDVYEP